MFPGSGGIKKQVSSEDRRQALREETEATLQEVSRKGQEYQNSMLRVPAEKVDSSEGASDVGATDCEEVCNWQQKQQQMLQQQQPTQKAGILKIVTDTTDVVAKPKDSNKAVDDSASAETNIFTVPAAKQQEPQQKQVQPAEPASNTSKLSDTDTFMAPPAKPVKSPSTTTTCTQVANDPDLLEHCPKTCSQKTSHSAHVKLTMGKCGPQKRQCPSSQSELSDCGYGTQVENQESISTSSNDDDGPQNKPQHQKPPCSSKPRKGQRNILTVIDKKELRRKKLVKRSKSSL